MEEYQNRVIEEKEALDEKIGKLTTFLVRESNQPLMTRQLVLMELYSQTLADRIATF